ncbi:MAG TPA: hypothetical protein VNX68_07400, partial [Nitrosopumilaceae archaeon]|nr:hypothetical protein [Nitrosopumilaceae archaeon]
AQVIQIRENLAPSKLIKNVAKDLVTSKEFKEDLFSEVISSGAGYLSKKLVVGSSKNPVKIILGRILQIAVSGAVAKNSEVIKSVGARIIDRLFDNKTPSS